MPCYHPLEAARSKTPDLQTGKHRISFHPKWASQYEPINLPCGRCRGCRHEHARQWAVRCVHEAQLYDKNTFITLTFNEQNLNSKGTLVKADFQNFIKRLRKHYYGNTKSDVRYFHCGEYGDNFGRPHHHACLFNFDFPDKIPWQIKEGSQLYRSETLEKLWPFGFSTIGAVTYDSAAYVARYVIKKINGKLAPGHYQGRQPEYTTMSRRPGIASAWYDKFGHTDVFPRDYVVLNGKKLKPPKYYSRIYELTNPEEYGQIRLNRIALARLNPNNDPDRLKAAEKIQAQRDQQLKRTYEKGIPQ
ncbi:MAG: replication initiator protein [Microvirus sp.]|nr:MAG: replication initiator protein [Microvirus sp.]